MRKPVLLHKRLTDGEFAEAMKGMPSQFYSAALKQFHTFGLHDNGVTWSWYYHLAIARVIPFNKVGELIAEIDRRLDEMLSSESTPPPPFDFFDEAVLAVLAPTPKPGARLFNVTSTSSNLFTPPAEGGLETSN